jgi:hypothetical protein
MAPTSGRGSSRMTIDYRTRMHTQYGIKCVRTLEVHGHELVYATLTRW